MYHRNKLSAGIIIIVAVFLMSLLNSCGKQSDSGGEEFTGSPVQITHPSFTNMTEYLNLNATTVFLNKEIVRATFQGFIVKVYKNIGDKVIPGDLLFRLRTKEMAGADTTLVNLGGKMFTGVIDIKANSNGVLTELDYHTGDFVTDGEQIAVISNPSTLRVKLNVPFEDVPKVRIGGGCEIELPDGLNVNGIIVKSIPAVDPVAQTQAFLIKTAEGQNIPENLNVTVKIPVKVFKGTAVLPKSSIVTNVTEDTFWIMKLLNDTTAVRVDISKGVENDSVAQILSPKLTASDRIVLTGAYGLPDTAKVEIEK